MPLALYGSSGFKLFMSAAIFETSSLSTPFILIIVCFVTVIFIRKTIDTTPTEKII